MNNRLLNSASCFLIWTGQTLTLKKSAKHRLHTWNLKKWNGKTRKGMTHIGGGFQDKCIITIRKETYS
jgi:hypothetical protein